MRIASTVVGLLALLTLATAITAQPPGPGSITITEPPNGVFIPPEPYLDVSGVGWRLSTDYVIESVTVQVITDPVGADPFVCDEGEATVTLNPSDPCLFTWLRETWHCGHPGDTVIIRATLELKDTRTTPPTYNFRYHQVTVVVGN